MAVATNDTYSAASGETIYGGREGLSTLPAWLAGADSRAWVEVPNSAPATYAPLPSPLASPGGSSVKAVVNAWCGAAVRQSSGHYLLHGGGHDDYGGNEIYAIGLADDAPVWSRPWGPTANADITENTAYYADGNPAAAHTYDALQYDRTNDRLMRFVGGYYSGASGANAEVNSWDWGAENWNPEGTHPDNTISNPDGPMATHPETGDVYIWINSKRLIWSRASNSYSYSASFGSLQPSAAALVVDPANGACWAIGGSNATSGKVMKWSLADNVMSSVDVTGDGSVGTVSTYCGAAMDPATGLIYVCTSAGAIYVFDPSALTFNEVTLTGTGPGTNLSYGNGTGTYNKFQYVEAIHAFVVLPAWAAPIFAFKP